MAGTPRLPQGKGGSRVHDKAEEQRLVAPDPVEPQDVDAGDNWRSIGGLVGDLVHRLAEQRR